MRYSLLFIVLSLQYSVFLSLISNVNIVKSHNNKATLHRASYQTLHAKKKSKLLVSDDFLSSLDDEAEHNRSTSNFQPNSSDKNQKSDTLVEIENGKSEKSDEGKSKKSKKKNKQQAEDIESDLAVKDHTYDIDASMNTSTKSDDDETLANEESSALIQKLAGETLEQRIRKEKPPSRIKFSESSQPGFAMMALEAVGLVFGNEEVLIDATFSVSTGERVGLVGPNGSGKTTQLKILAGDIEPTTGTVVKSSPNLRVSFLRQEFLDSLNPKHTLKEELYSTFVDEQKLLNDIAFYEAEIANCVDNESKMNEVLDKLQNLQEKAISKEVYSLNSKIEKIMDSIGFSKFDADSLINTFSGGWKMRIGLAKILLQDPNVILLDEPTNHLDLDSVFWLEDFLLKQNIPMVIVSHDREFLDRVCNKIVDTEEGISVSYTGNYSKFLEQRAVRLDLWREKYEKQVRYVKEEENIIKKAKSDPTQAHVVNAKLASLEKFKVSEDWVKQPPKQKKFRFRFPPSPRCGVQMVEVKSLTHGYDSSTNGTLFENVNIQIDRGDRIGFVGANGAGKSTLMRLIYGTEQPKSGYSEFTSNNVEVSYFEQSTADSLDLNRTVFETVQEVAPSDFTMTEIRSLLGQFMFKGDDADKVLSCLSGGEKARVALCRMMLKPANLLLLDEPTNHLDIQSKEVLEEALLNFEGSVLVISHDRYFMSQIAKQVFSFENKSVVRFDCDYHDFISGKDNGIKERIESRYVEGDNTHRITNAKEVIVEEVKSKRNFGGSGVTSGNLFKGIKNAKRYSNQ